VLALRAIGPSRAGAIASRFRAEASHSPYSAAADVALVEPALEDPSVFDAALADVARSNDAFRYEHDADTFVMAASLLGTAIVPRAERAIASAKRKTPGVRALERVLRDARGATKGARSSEAEPESAVDAVRRLVPEIDGEHTVLYLLEAAPRGRGSGISAIGGAPPVKRAAIPRAGKREMRHVITLDLANLPEARRGALEGARAVSVFVSPADDDDFDVRRARVVVSREADIAPGAAAAEPSSEMPCLRATRVTVPLRVFDEDAADEHGALAELRYVLERRAHAHALGRPIWLQGAEDGDDFILQFDAELLRGDPILSALDLGDSGVMYVFSEEAYWQCL
jgi:hypothetical protein